jgi:peptide/nickel transport system ATP-binding protein
MTPLLEIEKLSVTFGHGTYGVRAVTDVSFTLAPGRTLCLVGESGSGKSTVALALLRLLSSGSAQVDAGRASFAGESLLGMSEARLADLRGREIAMIFQDPMSSLNPAFTVGFQIIEAIRLHERIDAAAAERRALSLLERVRIPDARRRLDSYPHQLSGGMRQRVMIAMAMACRPKLLIADEPTTALDVTVQAQILMLMSELKRETGAAVLLITHDLGVVAEMADEVAVMYAGGIVEQGPVDDIFDRPAHAYTIGLLGAVPHVGAARRHARLSEIRGGIPKLTRRIEGCAFAPRCDHALPACTATPRSAHLAAAGHVTTCIRHAELAALAPHSELRHA